MGLGLPAFEAHPDAAIEAHEQDAGRRGPPVLEKPTMTDHAARADEYRERAQIERAAGVAAALDEVRAKHQRAAQVWADLAHAEDVRQAEREARRAAILERDAG